MKRTIYLSRESSRKNLGFKIYKMSIFILIISFWGFMENNTLLKVAQVIFFSSALLYILSDSAIRKKGLYYLIWGGIWLFFCSLSYVWSINKSSTIMYTISVLQVILIGSILSITVSEEAMLNYIEKCIVIGGILLSIRLLSSTPISQWGQERLGTSMGNNSNGIAILCLISQLFAINFFIREKDNKNKKIIYLVSIIILSLVIILTASKKAIILMVLGPLFMVTVYKDNFLIKIKTLIISITLVLILFLLIRDIPVIYNLAASRMEGLINLFTGNGTIDASTMERKYLATRAWEIFKENPIIGVGLNGFRYFTTVGRYAHCNYLELLADVGIIGTLIYYSIYLYSIKNILKKRKSIKRMNVYLVVFVIILALELASVTYLSEGIQLIIAYLSISTTILEN